MAALCLCFLGGNRGNATVFDRIDWTQEHIELLLAMWNPVAPLPEKKMKWLEIFIYLQHL